MGVQFLLPGPKDIMFICIEIDSEDITIWEQIDKAILQELGFTHVLWGINGDAAEKPACFPIPSNLFHACATDTAKNISNTVHTLIRKICSVAFNLVVIDDTSWSRQHQDVPLESIQPPSLESLEISRGE